MGTNFFDFKEKVSAPKGKRAKPQAGTGEHSRTADAKAADALTVSQITSKIDRILRDGFPQSILVKGEVSN